MVSSLGSILFYSLNSLAQFLLLPIATFGKGGGPVSLTRLSDGARVAVNGKLLEPGQTRQLQNGTLAQGDGGWFSGRDDSCTKIMKLRMLVVDLHIALVAAKGIA